MISLFLPNAHVIPDSGVNLILQSPLSNDRCLFNVAAGIEITQDQVKVKPIENNLYIFDTLNFILSFSLFAGINSNTLRL